MGENSSVFKHVPSYANQNMFPVRCYLHMSKVGDSSLSTGATVKYTLVISNLATLAYITSWTAINFIEIYKYPFKITAENASFSCPTSCRFSMVHGFGFTVAQNWNSGCQEVCAYSYLDSEIKRTTSKSLKSTVRQNRFLIGFGIFIGNNFEF